MKAFLKLLLSITAINACAGEAGWTEYGYVTELVPTAKHYYQVHVAVKNNTSGCDDITGFYQDYDSPGADQMYNALLEAVASKLKVRLYVTGKCNIHDQAEITSMGVARK